MAVAMVMLVPMYAEHCWLEHGLHDNSKHVKVRELLPSNR